MDCLLAYMDCFNCPVGACSSERAVQTEGVEVSPHCSVALPSRASPTGCCVAGGLEYRVRKSAPTGAGRR